jgi:dTDP-4-dehydrorhamnose reductase
VILVTGANGMVGSYFGSLAGEFDEPLELTDTETLNITDPSAVERRITSGGYSSLVHLAAETDVDRCEREPEHAFEVNATGTENVARACASTGIVMVYASTGEVFGGDGSMGPFTEADPPHPANVYGASKLAGERHVERLLNRWFIVRSAWMMGGCDKDKKFVGKVLSQVRDGRDISAVNDKKGSPTYARELVLGISNLMRSGRYGLYHMANRGACSRYEMACHIVEFLGAKVRVVPVDSTHFPASAPRASSEALRNSKLELVGMDRMSSWQDALDAYLEECTGRRSAAVPSPRSGAG